MTEINMEGNKNNVQQTTSVEEDHEIPERSGKSWLFHLELKVKGALPDFVITSYQPLYSVSNTGC